MPQDQSNPTQEDLQKEVEQLRAKVASFEKSKEKATKTRLFVAKKLGGFFLLGPQLKGSLIKIMEEDLIYQRII